MKTCTTLAVAILFAGAASAQSEPPLVAQVCWTTPPVATTPQPDLSARKHLNIPELPAAPQLDGDLGDAAWEGAAQTDTWMDNTGERPATVQTSARLGVHGGHLYIGVRAEEPNVAGLVASVTEDGGAVWEDDCVELFVDGNLDLQTSRQLVINSVGAVTTLRHGPGQWVARIPRAARVGTDAWFVELAVPLAGLDLAGSQFGINLCRERRAGGGEVELSCWSPTGGSFNLPGRFGLASLPGGWLQAFALGSAMLGVNELTATIENSDDRPRTLTARLTWWQGEGIALERSAGPFTLGPGASREVSFAYDVQDAGEPVQLEVAVLDEQGRELARREIAQPVADVLAIQVGRSVLLPGEQTVCARARLHVTGEVLARSRLIVALFRAPQMMLVARSEFAPPGGTVMSAELSLPALVPGDYTLHVVLKDAGGTRRIAEEKAALHVLGPVGAE
ncbi:MAG: carbohydrate-binding family 9-like protein [Armatimonadota bacterium]